MRGLRARSRRSAARRRHPQPLHRRWHRSERPQPFKLLRMLPKRPPPSPNILDSMRRGARWIVSTSLLIAVGIGLQTGVQADNSTAAATRADVRPGNCTANQLSVSLGQNLAGAGNRAFVLLFQNTSSSACRLMGYPTVDGLDASGRRVGATRHTTTNSPLDEPVRDVRMTSGQSASTLLQTRGIPVAGGSCVALESLLVRAPGTRRFFRVELKWVPDQGPATRGISACGTVFVDPVVGGVTSLF